MYPLSQIVPLLLNPYPKGCKEGIRKIGSNWLGINFDGEHVKVSCPTSAKRWMDINRFGRDDHGFHPGDVTHYIPFSQTCAILEWGLKVLVPSDDQCRIMERGRLSFPFDDYSQPFPATTIVYPDKWAQEWVDKFGSDWLPMMSMSQMACDKRSVMFSHFFCRKQGSEYDNITFIGGFVLRDFGPNSFEEALQHTCKYVYNEAPEMPECMATDEIPLTRVHDIKGLEGSLLKMNRVAVNMCMLATNYGTKGPTYPNPDHRKKLERKASKNADALKEYPEIYQVTQFLNANLSQHHSQGDGSHASPRPHFRSGHWKQQPHGKGNALRKHIFVDWTFVGIDKVKDIDADTSVYEKKI